MHFIQFVLYLFYPYICNTKTPACLCCFQYKRSIADYTEVLCIMLGVYSRTKSIRQPYSNILQGLIAPFFMSYFNWFIFKNLSIVIYKLRVDLIVFVKPFRTPPKCIYVLLIYLHIHNNSFVFQSR